MSAIDPQQEFFSALKVALTAKGFAVYDGFLPPDGTPYPFVYLGDCRQSDEANKSAVFGRVYQTIHVWSNTPKNRGTVSGMLLAIKGICRTLDHTANFAWMVRGIDQQILPDNTTKTPLLHGILEVEVSFS